MLSHYAKSIGFLIAAGFTALIAANTDGVITGTEVVNVALAIVGAAVIYLIPNLPAGVGVYAKSIAAAVVAALTVLASALLTPGVDLTEWLQIGVAALGALGVFIVPNTAPVEPAAVEPAPVVADVE